MGDEQKNKDVVRKIEGAWNKHDVAALDQYFDASFNNHAGIPGLPGGLQGAKMAHAGAMKSFPDRSVEMLSLIGEGDLVMIRNRVRGTNTGGAAFLGMPTANGQKIDFESWSIYKFKSGKVVESWGLNDGLLGMIQLGSLKPPQM